MILDSLSSQLIHLNVAVEKNQNLTAPQQENNLTHRKAGHANGQWCQELMRERKFHYEEGDIETLPFYPLNIKVLDLAAANVLDATWLSWANALLSLS